MQKILFALLLFPLSVAAAIAVEGTFEADKYCPAYVSKSKQSNPDNLSTLPHNKYRILAINRLSPNWVRIEFPAHTPAFRWVKAECGTAQYEIKNNTHCEKIPGLANSTTLALHWLPGFCEAYGFEQSRPDCIALSGETYQANNFVLHGLWPVQKGCGEEYVFCEQDIKANYCEYPPLNVSSSLMDTLKRVLPSFGDGSCVERHEWTKHGSCQLLSYEEYFSIAARLTEEFNQTALSVYLRAHVGEKVEKSKLYERIVRSFGYDADNKILLRCAQDMLVEVLVTLPADLTQQESLETLVQKTTGALGQDKCPKVIRISDFSHEQ